MEHQGDSMSKRTINIVRDFSPTPFGRYTREVQPGEEDTTGEHFRLEILAPAMHQYEKVHVDLSGYNRYGPSFLDEAFAGLISSGEFQPDEVRKKLTYSHDMLPSIIELIDNRINHAISFEDGDS